MLGLGLGINYYIQASYPVIGISRFGFEFDFANNTYILGT